jgi:hypothetical protein
MTMKIFTLLATVLISSLLLSACNRNQVEQQLPLADPYAQVDPAFGENAADDYWAKDNFDLQRVGHLLERSNSPEEFERYLNDDEYNNLDLNGDNYADYISVEEFGDSDNERGLSLFSRFGPDLIQHIATIFLRRDNFNQPGARILIEGNEQLYGDNSYYETNWIDRSLGLVTSLFGDRDHYRSPYYYDNYPSYYDPYPIVETPIYRSRIETIFPQPAFIYTTTPTVINIEQVRIRSPHEGKWMDKVYAKLAKPTKQQIEFVKSNPEKVKFKKNKGVRGDDFVADKPGRIDPPRSDRGDERGNPGRDERGAQRGNPNKPDHQNMKPVKFENPNKGGGNPNKMFGNPNKGGGNPNKGFENPHKGGGNPNKGGGNPNKGGGNPNKGGGGKGGGKKG